MVGVAGDCHRARNDATHTLQQQFPSHAQCNLQSASARGREATQMCDAALAALMRWPRVDLTVGPAAPHHHVSNDDSSDIYVVACALDFILTRSWPNSRHRSGATRAGNYPSEISHRQEMSSPRASKHAHHTSPQPTRHAEQRLFPISWESEECTYSSSQRKDTCREYTSSYMHAGGASRAMHACAALRRTRNGSWASSRLFAIGGRDTTWRGIACTASYDAVKDEWQYGPPLPSSMQYVRAVGLDEALFVFGNMLHPLKMHIDWDWRKEEWQSGPAEGGIAWRQLQYVEAVAVDSEVWILGGRRMPNNVSVSKSCCFFSWLPCSSPDDLLAISL
jgi:hypothetical protein